MAQDASLMSPGNILIAALPGGDQATWYYIMPKSGTNRHIKFGGHHPPPPTQIVPGTNRYIQF